MKRQFAISPDNYKWIKAEASKLPPVSRKTQSGATITRLETKVKKTTFTTNPKGNKINTKYDKQHVPVLVNHENELVLAWKAKGSEGANIYIQIINELEKSSLTQKSYSICLTLVENLVKRKVSKIADPRLKQKFTKEKITAESMKAAFTKISAPALGFFDKNAALLTNEDMVNICLEEVPDKYKKLESWFDFNKVLTEYYDSI